MKVTREADDDWSGARGRIGRDDLAQLVHDPATLCFICGPPALVSQMPGVLENLGVPSERIRIEAWN
jgi:ferredoxin-NADP reductase